MSDVMEDRGQLISFRPDLVLRPTSIDELKAALEGIHQGELGNGRVRVPGSLHSYLVERIGDVGHG